MGHVEAAAEPAAEPIPWAAWADSCCISSWLGGREHAGPEEKAVTLLMLFPLEGQQKAIGTEEASLRSLPHFEPCLTSNHLNRSLFVPSLGVVP